MKVSENRLQIYISTSDLTRARAEARRLGISVAAFVREAISEYLRHGCRKGSVLRKDSPIHRMVGAFSDPRPPGESVAEHHDKYLYGELDWRQKPSS